MICYDCTTLAEQVDLWLAVVSLCIGLIVAVLAMRPGA